MLWVVVGMAVWLVLAALVGVLVGRSIRLAERRSRCIEVDAVLTTADLPNFVAVG